MAKKKPNSTNPKNSRSCRNYVTIFLKCSSNSSDCSRILCSCSCPSLPFILPRYCSFIHKHIVVNFIARDACQHILRSGIPMQYSNLFRLLKYTFTDVDFCAYQAKWKILPKRNAICFLIKLQWKSIDHWKSPFNVIVIKAIYYWKH